MTFDATDPTGWADKMIVTVNKAVVGARENAIASGFNVEEIESSNVNATDMEWIEITSHYTSPSTAGLYWIECFTDGITGAEMFTEYVEIDNDTLEATQNGTMYYNDKEYEICVFAKDVFTDEGILNDVKTSYVYLPIGYTDLVYTIGDQGKYTGSDTEFSLATDNVNVVSYMPLKQVEDIVTELRLEGIEIVLLPKGVAAPGDTAKAYENE